MKICIKCKIEKEFSRFRWRTSKKQKPYWNSTCRDCDNEWNRNAKHLLSKTSDYRKEKRIKYKDKISEYNHHYSIKNRVKLTEYKRLEMRIKRSNLHDTYVVKILSESTGLSNPQIRLYPEFIKAYKIKLQFKRAIENEQNRKC